MKVGFRIALRLGMPNPNPSPTLLAPPSKAGPEAVGKKLADSSVEVKKKKVKGVQTPLLKASATPQSAASLELRTRPRHCVEAECGDFLKDLPSRR